jgi:hypothetical protein
MLSSRYRCAFSVCLLSVSLLLGLAHDAFAQKCGCSKTNQGIVPPAAAANPSQRFMNVNQSVAVPGASVPAATPSKHHHHQQQQTAGTFPGQTTPWLLPNQPSANPNYSMTGTMNPLTSQTAYNFTQPLQPGLYQNQQLANPNYPATGLMNPLTGQPAYNFAQPIQPGFNQNQPLANPNYPVTGQMVPLMNQSAYSSQNMTGYLPPQATTPWALQPGLIPNQTATNSWPNSQYQTGMVPSQTVSLQNPSLSTAALRPPSGNSSVASGKSCMPNQTGAHQHAKKK